LFGSNKAAGKSEGTKTLDNPAEEGLEAESRMRGDRTGSIHRYNEKNDEVLDHIPQLLTSDSVHATETTTDHIGDTTKMEEPNTTFTSNEEEDSGASKEYIKEESNWAGEEPNTIFTSYDVEDSGASKEYIKEESNWAGEEVPVKEELKAYDIYTDNNDENAFEIIQDETEDNVNNTNSLEEYSPTVTEREFNDDVIENLEATNQHTATSEIVNIPDKEEATEGIDATERIDKAEKDLKQKAKKKKNQVNGRHPKINSHIMKEKLKQDDPEDHNAGRNPVLNQSLLILISIRALS